MSDTPNSEANAIGDHASHTGSADSAGQSLPVVEACVALREALDLALEQGRMDPVSADALSRAITAVEESVGTLSTSAANDREISLDGLDARAAEMRRLASKLEEQLAYRARLNRQAVQQRRALSAAEAEVAALRSSFAFRLGSLLVDAVRQPSSLLHLPVALAKLCRELWPRILRRLRGGGVSTSDRPDFGPELSLGAGRALADAEENDAARSIARMLLGTATAPRLPDDTATMRVATVMDEFSFAAFRHCGNFRQLHGDSWRDEIEDFLPHMLLVESAWKGLEESWARKVYPLSRDLVEMIRWCRERGIPTAFWNKEDPVHLSVFMRTARQFDFVFTTDIDCVRAYKAALGHEQVYWLPFACQPADHNPMEEYRRKDAFCFAGSFYAKYPERQRDFATLVKAMGALRPVEIFDRNAEKNDPALLFPDEYAPLIQGSLPHDQISMAYKGYRFGININTVKQSQSMFARRAFDLLASNTVTVSNFSRGLRMLLGDLVITSDDAGQLDQRVRPLVEDEARYRRFRLAGLRKVLSEHTYQDRWRYVLEKIGGKPLEGDLPHVVAIARASDAAQAEAAWATFSQQVHARKELLLVMPVGSDPVPLRPGLTVVDERAAAQIDVTARWPDAWLACLFAQDHYGPSYLLDLALATRYADASVIGKAAYHAWAEGQVRLQGAGSEYRLNDMVAWRRAIVAVHSTPLRIALDVALDGPDRVLEGACSVDEYNYCMDGSGQDVHQAVDDLPGLWTGISLNRLHRLAETATAADVLAAEQSTSRSIDAAGLAELLPVGSHAHGAVRLDQEAAGLRLRSTLPSDRHVYLYASSPVPSEDLFDGAIGKFNMAVESEMLVSFVMIFLDGKGERIGHAIRACSSNLSLVAPAGTHTVRLGLRIQGSGTALLRRLVLGHVPSPVAGVPARGRHLLISRGYPAYTNLYSYAYVHRRVLGYAEEGTDVDVFRLVDDHMAFDEFEGVDVVSGQLADLELMIRSNTHRSLMAHSLDRALWSVLEPHAADRRILVWIHGAEIQPWYRREFSFLDERDRERGIQRSNERMAFWRELFAAPPDNVTFVFVSRHLAREAFRDVGIELDESRYTVIHNHVDGDFFAYRPKTIDQRLKILSIRPYTRPTYANDLTVKAILDLSSEPYFPSLHFRLVGDGRLFEQTVEPLRGMRNVVLEKRFLTQAEIAGMHRDYGVFLAPTRIDSQGVSRDEAMASGLVPVTNRVSAIPEFVDERSALIVGAEDWKGMADAIRTLHDKPETFTRLSEAAARRVRQQSGRSQTLDREVALINGLESGPDNASASEVPARRPRVALYGDLDMNLVDGSAIWAASLARVLAEGDRVDVDLFLKAPIRQAAVIRELLGAVNVRLIEPDAGVSRRTSSQALDAIVQAHSVRCYDAIVLRGFALAREAVDRVALHGRIWVYLTDIPQDSSDIDPAQHARLEEVVAGSSVVLCQTPELEQHVLRLVPEAGGKTRLLPPMVPDTASGEGNARCSTSGPLRLVYAGKFAPQWGTRELFSTFDQLRAEGIPVELHVFGDKIHNPQDDPGFRDEVRARLEAGDGINWHRACDRSGVMAQLATMDVGWAWRHASLEEGTLELSTKVLEYAAMGVAPLVAPGPVNRRVLGDDYPLLATSAQLLESLRAMARDRTRLQQVQQTVQRLADDYRFTVVGSRFIAPLIDSVRTARGNIRVPGTELE